MGGEIERVRIWFENLGALAVLLMWFRQLRTLTIISSQMAVLWHMMVSMLGDVVSFLQMLVVVLLGFTGALAMVFWEDVVPLAVNGECDGLIGDGTTWWSISKKLFEGSMLGDGPCAYLHLHRHRRGASPQHDHRDDGESVRQLLRRRDQGGSGQLRSDRSGLGEPRCAPCSL